MSSPYQILDNRPLDQWKVTELKDELRKRRLTIGGLKQDLINRLDDAVRTEREEAAKEASQSCDFHPSSVDNAKYAEPVAPEIAQATITHSDNGSGSVDDIKVLIDINDSAMVLGQGEFQQGGMGSGANSADKEEVLVVSNLTNISTDTKSIADDATAAEQDLPQVEVKSMNVCSQSQLKNDDCKSEPVNEDLKPQLANEETKAPPVTDVHDLPAANNQVSEVSPNQGFQVSSDFNSNDSVSINEKIGLKDNIIADDAKIEFDLGNPEMVEPSSSHVVPDGGDSHPMDVEEPRDNRLSVEKNDAKAANAEMSKNNDNEDLGYSEKLNLDRSSGDDSIEEDVQDGKQVDLNYDSGEGIDRSEKNEIPVEKENSPVDIVGDSSPANKKEIAIEEKNPVVADKRKMNELEAAGINEPIKRQRKWNAENNEQQGSIRISATTLKETFPVAAPKRSLSRSDSNTGVDSPKDRIVPPSENPATNSLRIDNFVRPFTLKAVQELLGKTGTVTSFWMDHIKTHCYVTYSSVDEATATRDAVYNLRWPPYGGQLLAAEFVDSEEVKLRVDPPSQAPATAPIISSGPQVPPSQPQPSPRQKVTKQQASPAHALPPPPPLSNPLTVRERINLPPPPPPPEKVDPPIVTLDDLFRKTKATPRIYYLPLSEEQVAAKLKARDRSTKP